VRARQRAAVLVGLPGYAVVVILAWLRLVPVPWGVAVLFAAWGTVAIRTGFHNEKLWRRLL